ncbi:sigma-70 family RNA polymerase sigma factor [Echinicola strongylocentroti]|uniref:Sigma-70 family RNA polymerase sigma factor n=1 Tax=Echinicola strongylocentroti TaxID=1795355 RepID=A0A2Z4IIW0_9BACT|nr:sigma-70 family RNA polymerase sigma factor [Echinicola strongylocentroti]AWW30884.1 sigma-70 family RNA polymerase sigma factor [Echinicola strongylocentroti]
MASSQSHISDLPVAVASTSWESLRVGNQDGLKSLYSLYVDEMYRYGMAVHSNSSLVKDCIQEVFINLWKYRTNLRSDVNVKQYLFKALRNKVVKEIEKEKKHYQDFAMDEYEYLLLAESSEKKMIDEHDLSLLQRKLSTGIEALPSRQREVLRLLFFEEVSYEEVSEIMGINLRSVYTLAWKAISKLKKSIIILLFTLGLLF